MSSSPARAGRLSARVLALVAIGVTTIAAPLGASTAMAAPPVNDNFAAATPIASNTSASGSIVEATGEAGEPGGQGTLTTGWWSWTAPSAGYARVVIQSPFNAYLCIYTGAAVNALTLYGCNDDAYDGSSSLGLAAVAGTTYMIQVDGKDALTGTPVVVNVSFQAGVPGPPSLPTAFTLTTNAGDRSATLRWQPPASNGGRAITGYIVQRNAIEGHNQSTQVLSASARSYTFSNLHRGGVYTILLWAINGPAGDINNWGPELSGTATIPAGKPGTPVIGTAVSGVAGGPITATANWTPPQLDGGSPITGYLVRALRMSSSGTVLSTTLSAVQPATARTLSMTLPRTGTYRFDVQAINAIAAGPRSQRSNAVSGR